MQARVSARVCASPAEPTHLILIFYTEILDTKQCSSLFTRKAKLYVFKRKQNFILGGKKLRCYKIRKLSFDINQHLANSEGDDRYLMVMIVCIGQTTTAL